MSVSAEDGQQNGNDFLNAEGSDGGQGDDAVENRRAGLELICEERKEIFGDDGVLAVAEIAEDGNGEALGGGQVVAASGAQQIGNGHHGDLLQSL